MKIGILFLLGIAAITAMGATGQRDLSQLRSATEQLQRPEMAQAAGFNIMSGLNYCNPSFGDRKSVV